MASLTASLVIPTYNRAQILARLLESVLEQEGDQLYQVIVCDDGSSDDTESVVAGFRGRLPLDYRFQEDRGFRAGQARNLGIAAARGDVLIFVDDDLVLPPGFVAAHCRAHRDGEAVVGLGERMRVRSRSEDLRPDVLSRDAEPDDRADVFATGLDQHPAPWKLLYSCNLSLPRKHPEVYFDERFVGWGQEDTDIGYRLWRARASYRFVRGATAFHVEDMVPRDPFRREQIGIQPDYESYLRNCVRLLDKFPEDEELWNGVMPDLRWYERDPELGKWHKNGTENDPSELIKTIRAEMNKDRVLIPVAPPVRVAVTARPDPREAALTRPLDELAVEFTVYCNLSCKMCSVWKGRQHGIPLPLAKEVLAQARALGARKLTPCGAESFARSDIHEILEHAHGLGFEEICIVTNGLLLTEARLDRLERLGSCLRLNISLDGPEEIHDQLRGTGTFAKLQPILRSLKRRGFSFGLSSVVMQQTIGRLEEVIDLAVSLGVGSISLQPYQPEIAGTDADHGSMGFMDLDAATIRRRLEAIAAYADQHGVEIYTRSMLDLIPAYLSAGVRPIPVGGCWVPSRFMLIDYRGLAYPCFFMRDRAIGSVYETPLRDLWHNETQRELNVLALSSKCPGCLAACSDIDTYDRVKVQGVLS